MSALTDLKKRITGPGGNLLDRTTVEVELEMAIAREKELAAMCLPQQKPAAGYWWCPECKEEVPAARVTNQELHEDCGRAVEWKEPLPDDGIRFGFDPASKNGDAAAYCIIAVGETEEEAKKNAEEWCRRHYAADTQKPSAPMGLIAIWNDIYQRLLCGSVSYKELEAIRRVMDEIVSRYRPIPSSTDDGLRKELEAWMSIRPEMDRTGLRMELRQILARHPSPAKSATAEESTRSHTVSVTGRLPGKFSQAAATFEAACEAGQDIIYQAVNWVAMSRRYYETLVRANGITPGPSELDVTVDDLARTFKQLSEKREGRP